MSQFINKPNHFDRFSSALDGSTETVQLCCLFWDLMLNLKLSKLVSTNSFHTTSTGERIVSSLGYIHLRQKNVESARYVTIIHGKNMCGRKRELVGRVYKCKPIEAFRYSLYSSADNIQKYFLHSLMSSISPVNFIRSRGSYRRQFRDFSSEIEARRILTTHPFAGLALVKSYEFLFHDRE